MMIRVLPLAIYHGPNPLSADPILLVDLEIAEQAIQALELSIDDLQQLTADWYQAPAPPPAVDQAATRIGAFLADWALQALTFVRGQLRAAGCRYDPESGRSRVWLGFHDAHLSLQALQLGAGCLQDLAVPQASSEMASRLPAKLDRFWQACRQRHPDYQAGIVMTAARRRDLPYAPAWGLARHWRFGQGERGQVLFESSTSLDGHFGARVAASKSATKAALRALGLPTPPFRLVRDEAELEAAVAAVGFPCATKPIDRGGGKGVLAGLLDLEQVRQGFRTARQASGGPVMVEGFVAGEDHRLMVVDGCLVAAIRREPPSVIGDGERSIRELVVLKNLDRDARGLVRSGYLRPILLDASACAYLSSLGLGPDSIPASGQRVRVRSNANLSTGGDCVDVTQEVHAEVRQLAESVARTLHLRLLGLDYLTSDIGQRPYSGDGQFIEINTTPGLDAMIAAGWSVEAAGDLALPADLGRIPVHLLIVRQAELDQTLQALQACPWPAGMGWATSSRAGLMMTTLAVAAGEPWAGVQTLLSHGTLTEAVILASDEEIRRHGLPLDRLQRVWVAAGLEPAWQRVLRTCAVDQPMSCAEDAARHLPARLFADLLGRPKHELQ